MKEHSKLIYQIIILLVLAFFVIFLKLGEFHMRLWDESMFAVNTYEMMHNGHYFSNYYQGHIDICNNKPVLSLWTQIISVKLFGYNELALRLPSAIAAMLAIALIFVFLYKNYSVIWAWASALVLLTSAGFIGYHTARTAEADSMLTLFLLISNVFFIQFIRTDKTLNILYFFLFLTLTFATKLVAALLFLPALPIILFIFKKFKKFVFNPFFVLGILLFLSVNIMLIILRMQENPQYLHDLLNHDAGRLLQVTDNFKGAFSFYADNLILERFSIWFILLMIGFIMTFTQKQEKERNLLIMLFTFTVSYLLIISASATKVIWYDMPLYPFMAIIAAYPIFVFIRWFSTSGLSACHLRIIIILIVIFFYPYYIIFRQSQANSLNGFEKMNEASERYLFGKNKEKADLSGTKVLFTGYNGSLLFYKYKMHEMGQEIDLTMNADFQPNDKVLVSNDSLKNVLKREYILIKLDSMDNAVLVKIESKIQL